MYDWPQVRAATDALWAAVAERLRDRGLDAPAALTRDRDPWDIWRDPGLLLAQTCGLPYVSRLRGTVRLVATPAYAAAGCAGSDYCSIVVVRGDDPAADLAALRGRRAAYNDPGSQSGHAALCRAVAPLARDGAFFAAAVRTGAHLDSLRAVAGGAADVAAVDAVCWALARRHHPEVTERLRVLARTPATPGLPLVTAAARPDAEVAALRAALDAAAADPALAVVRDALLITGFEVRGDGDYEAIARGLREAADLGYPDLN
ncbi:MAG: PhnD/SsuA/transferrin family substrate-binding protein [Hyphomicrobiales bacterium]|nr:PhnD/SsuA/transferrin family substrate-binding protein [Hyphomicrobiales bacterium]MCP5371701.1 PhnD/SsuA/transferrin family substrate-binding protein [Hyphomicrobiales bacterium]